MRNICCAMALIVAFGAAALAQDPGRGGDKQSKGCDVKTTEKGKYCEACKELVDEKDVEKGLHKGKGDDHKVVDCEVCVKKYFEASCHPDKRSAKPSS